MNFSLRTLLTVALLAACALWAIPRSIYHYQTWSIKSELNSWLANQTPETPTYQSCCIISYGGASFYVSRAQQEYDASVDQWLYTESKQPDGALYVAPPGIWCQSVDEARLCIWETSQVLSNTQKRLPDKQNFE